MPENSATLPNARRHSRKASATSGWTGFLVANIK